MKTSTQGNDDETESEDEVDDEVDDEEFETSDIEGEPTGDKSGEDELDTTHTAHIGHDGACEDAMDDKEFLKWIGRKRSETTRKNNKEEHVLKVATENEADEKLVARINALSPASKARMMNTHIEMIMEREILRRDQTARDSALSRDRMHQDLHMHTTLTCK